MSNNTHIEEKLMRHRLGQLPLRLQALVDLVEHHLRLHTFAKGRSAAFEKWSAVFKKWPAVFEQWSAVFDTAATHPMQRVGLDSGFTRYRRARAWYRLQHSISAPT
jgi:hypothetical protein